MMLGGAALMAAGIVAVALNPWGYFLHVVGMSVISAGAGLALLGGVKRARPTSPDAPPPTDVRVLDERARRIRAFMEGEGPREFTFEEIMTATRWMQDAVVSALVHMKERGEVVEDLNLDTGQWVYRLQDRALMSGQSLPPMLQERQAALAKDDER